MMANPSRRQMLRFSRLLGPAVLAFGLTACSRLLGQAAPPKLFELEPRIVLPAGLRQLGLQLVVQLPDIAGGLDTARIALSRPPFTLDYFADAAWTDRVPVLAQSLIIQSFQNSGVLLAVGREALILRSDYVLRADIRDFQASYDQESRPPTARIRLFLTLVRTADRSIVSQHQEDRRVPAMRNDLNAIIAAFNDAMGQVLSGMIGWIATLPQPVIPATGASGLP